MNDKQLMEKNKRSLEEWKSLGKDRWSTAFAEFFDNKESLEKFMRSVEDAITRSCFSNSWGSLQKDTPEARDVYYDQMLNSDDLTVNMEKTDSFLKNIYNTMTCVSSYQEDVKAGGYDGRASLDRTMIDARTYFEKAFRSNEGFDKNEKYFAITFMLSHFLGNEKSMGIIDMMTPYIQECFGDNPKEKRFEGSEFVFFLEKYEKEKIKENKQKVNVSLSNNMDKLFAGESSELGKGANKKQMS